MNIYQPYTYLIGWTQYNKWYYGVEYGNKTKTANPKNLWTNYYTSSKIVKLFRKTFGEPDIIQIRKIFETAEKAIMWEQKVLRRIDVRDNVKWLNITQTSGKFHTNNKKIITDGIQQLMVDKDTPIFDGWRTGISDKVRSNRKIGSAKRSIHFTKEAHKKSVEKRKNSVLITNEEIIFFHPKEEPIPEGFRVGMTKAVCEKRSSQRSGVKHSQKRKENISKNKKGFKFINNGVLEKQTKDTTLPEGFFWGRLPRTEEHRKNAKESRMEFKWYTNGTKDIQCKLENVPDGFNPGRSLTYKSSKESIQKRIASVLGKKWYTNGTKNVRSFKCPDGFWSGKTHKV